MGGYDAFMDITISETKYPFFFNMKGWCARFSLYNEERKCYFHFRETTKNQQLKSLKEALKQGFTNLKIY